MALWSSFAGFVRFAPRDRGGAERRHADEPVERDGGPGAAVGGEDWAAGAGLGYVADVHEIAAVYGMGFRGELHQVANRDGGAGWLVNGAGEQVELMVQLLDEGKRVHVGLFGALQVLLEGFIGGDLPDEKLCPFLAFLGGLLSGRFDELQHGAALLELFGLNAVDPLERDGDKPGVLVPRLAVFGQQVIEEPLELWPGGDAEELCHQAIIRRVAVLFAAKFDHVAVEPLAGHGDEVGIGGVLGRCPEHSIDYIGSSYRYIEGGGVRRKWRVFCGGWPL